MALSIGWILLGIVMLVLGGETLLRGAVGLATLLKLTPAVIGLTVVAAGTSVPELAVSGIAAYQGKTEIAVANVVGSNLFNIAVILGVCSMVRPMVIGGNTVKLEYPVLALVTLLCLVLCRDGQVDRLDAVLCLCVYVAFITYLVGLVRQQVTATESRELSAEVSEFHRNPPRPRIGVCLGFLCAGVALLGGGAHATVVGASELARMLNWSERMIGLTVVSMGTGLPELMASLVSSFRGRSDVALGNVIGSNLFNILGILGLTGLASPLPVSPELIARDCWWMLGITLLLFPLMLTGRRVRRWEGAGLLAAYTAYLWLLLKEALPPPA
jgi:cation:H+ antiporter